VIRWLRLVATATVILSMIGLGVIAGLFLVAAYFLTQAFPLGMEGKPAMGPFWAVVAGTAAGISIGLGQAALDHAVAYAREREQFGRKIASFQATQFKLADMATEIGAGRALVYKAAWLKDRGRPFAQEAAMAKLYTGELARRVVNEALQIHGGYGYMEELPIARFYRDQKVLEIGEGTNEVQRLVIARHLGL